MMCHRKMHNCSLLLWMNASNLVIQITEGASNIYSITFQTYGDLFEYFTCFVLMLESCTESFKFPASRF